jgi:outer membrane protein
MNNERSLIDLLRVNTRWFIAIAVAISIQCPAKAQETLTLSQAINNAIANRKNIQAGKSDQIIRKLQTGALYRKYWPQVNVEYTYLYNPILQTSILPIGVFNPSYPADATKSIQFGTKWSQTAGLTLNQPLIDVSINRQINEAKLQERITAASQAQTEYELAYAVAQVYFDINLQETKIRSAIADTSRTWISYQLLQNKFEQKRLLKSELNKARINHNNATQQYRKALSQWIEDKVYLLFLIGRNDIEHPDIIIDTAFFKNEQLTSMKLEPGVSNIPELQQLQLKGDLIDVQTKTEKAKHLPTVSAKGFIGANQYTNNFDPFAANTWFGVSYIGIDLKYPLLFGEDKRKRLQQLQLQSTQYYEQKDDKAAQYFKDGLIAKIRMEQVLSELKVQEENITLSVESISIFQARVSEGQESSANLNIEEADLQKLNADYQSNRRQYWLYFLDYLKASGKLEILWKQ